MADAKLEIILAAKDAATRTVDRAADQIRSQLTDLEHRAAQFARNWLQVTAAIYGMAKAWDEVKLGARAEQERRAFENMAASYGQNADHIIDKLKQASGHTIDTMTLINKAGTAMMMGIAPEKLHKLMEIARATTRMTGQTVTKAFEDITVAIGRQSARILDNLAIMVSVGKANEAWAKSLRKSVDQLSDVEQKQAFLNAAIEGGEKLMQRLGATSKRTTAEMFQSWEALSRNVRTAVSEGVVKVVKWMVITFTAAGSTINQVFEQITQGWAYIFQYIGSLPGGELLGFKALGDSLAAVAENFRGAREEAYSFISELMDMDAPTIRPIVVKGALPHIEAYDQAAFKALQERLHAEAAHWELMEKVRHDATQKGLTLIQDAMEAETRAIQAGLDEQAAAIQAGIDDIAAIRAAGFAKGLAMLDHAMAEETRYIEEAMNKVPEAATSMSENIKNAVTGWASSFAQALTDAVWGAEQSFARIAEAFGRMLTQMMMQKMIVEPLLGWFTGLFPSAKGNVFTNGRIVPYGKGDIISRPTIFPMANGNIGLAGEKDPEAIMPLARLPSGDLGVKAQGAGTPPAVTVNVNNNTGTQARVRQERPTWSGQEWVINVWLDAYERNVNGMRDIIGV